MMILDVVQGSPEWAAIRTKYRTASEAPVMMGASHQMTRGELIRLKAAANECEYSDWVQVNLLDKGHEVEAQARAIVEQMIGEELFPATATDDADYLLASSDGVTMTGDVGWEHKLWNEELAAKVRAGKLEPMQYWQLEQLILVFGLDKIIFVCSDGTLQKFVSLEYKAVPGRAEQLLAGWKQFDEDAANYQHVEVLPGTVAEPILALPALSIQVSGQVSLISNLDIFGAKLKAFVGGLNRNPSDDQAFADCEAAVKVLQKAQDALEAAEASALAQTASIDEMRGAVAMYAELARANRLMLEKLVNARKETIRIEIMRGGEDAFKAHIAGLNQRLGKPYMPTVPADFAGVMKGKKTISSLRDAVASELARAKIDANAVADKIQINLTTLRELAADYAFLFHDTAQIVLKANDDLTALVKLRIAEHKQAEEKKLEAERERIRHEEAAKLERQQAKTSEPAPAQQQAQPAQVQSQAQSAPGTSRPWTTPELRQKITDAIATFNGDQLAAVLRYIKSISPAAQRETATSK